VAALLPDNVADFGRGLGLPDGEVRLFLALREAAYHRLFGHVPWLKQRLLDAVEAYARGITVDRDAIARAMSGVDPEDPESIQRALEGGMFEPSVTEEQTTALARLETLLALVEGWVDDVVASAATDRLPGSDALRETLRRRRATGGPAEQTFATLVGLELRPRRLREAAELWRLLRERSGPDGRDRLWQHPDLLPGADDLDDPEAFVRGIEDDTYPS
jgi:putative hydrolase